MVKHVMRGRAARLRESDRADQLHTPVQTLEAERVQLMGHIEMVKRERDDMPERGDRLKEVWDALHVRLEDVYVKDRGKTKEINILTQENRTLSEERNALKAELASITNQFAALVASLPSCNRKES